MPVYSKYDFSIKDCEHYLELHGRYMDPYAYEVMQWLVAEVRRLEKALDHHRAVHAPRWPGL